MISAVGGYNSLQMINALNAFGGNKKVENQDIQYKEFDTSNGINLADNDNLLQKINLREIKNYAQQAGEMNLSDDDIKYGLTYGRSVIADYTA